MRPSDSSPPTRSRSRIGPELIALASASIFAICARVEREVGPGAFAQVAGFAKTVAAVAGIQGLAAALESRLDSRRALPLAGFLSGCVSSTALTLAVARDSRRSPSPDFLREKILYASATSAMLAQAAAIVWIALPGLSARVAAVLAAPLALTLTILVFLRRRLPSGSRTPLPQARSSGAGALQLGLFVVVVVGLARAAADALGNSALFLLTLVTSLFEMHASLIATAGLAAQAKVPSDAFAFLLATSILASYGAKAGIVAAFGAPRLARAIGSWTVVVAASISIAYLLTEP